MILIALYITIAMVTLAALLNVYRVIKGPMRPIGFWRSTLSTSMPSRSSFCSV